MKRATLILALMLVVTGATTGTTAAAGAPATGAPADTVRLPAIDQEILSRLNAVRVSHGLRPVTLSGELRSAAVFHSRAMLEGGFFAHESQNGSPFDERVRRFYRATGYRSWSAGENLLYSTAEIDAASAIKAWLESPAHRDNLLGRSWREVGIGTLHRSAAGGTFGGQPTWVITMDFGVRSGGGAAAKLASVIQVVRTDTPEKTATPSGAPPRPKPTKPVTRRIERILPRPQQLA